MATIAATDMSGYGSRAVTITTLDGSDGFAYNEGRDPTLILSNSTGNPLSPVIDGDEASTVPVPGAGSYDISGGYEVGSIADGETVAIPLRTIRQYLVGTIAVSSGTGLEAQLLEY